MSLLILLGAGAVVASPARAYEPPDCVSGQELFPQDVSAGHPYCAWIEELFRRDATSGCAAGRYCPDNPATRAQIAALVLRAVEACPTLAANDEMVRVGGVCIDKYEASLWDHPTSTDPSHLIVGAIPCSATGQDCDNIWARSVAGVQPRASITWFQAQRALVNSGKRFPTNAEWQMAAAGTPDPGAVPGSEDCNVSSGGPEVTGERANCFSAFGVRDMVGNLWEWVAEWVPLSTGCTSWSATSDDHMCLSGASTTATSPAALLRGGDWGSGVNAGPLAVSAVNPIREPMIWFGFRGAR